MKKSYIKIILFISILSFIFLSNSFVFRKLETTGLNIIMLLSLVVFYMILGFEKDRHRYVKDVILEIVIFLIAFFLIYYLFGIIIGFAKNTNYFTIKSFLNIIIPIILYIFIKEFLRYQLLKKSSESWILIVLTCVFFIIMDNVIALESHILGFNRDTFLLIAVSILPSITENILCTYLGIKEGYKPGIVYLLIINLYKYLMPIVPNPSEYLYSLIFLIIPILLLKKIINWYKSDRTDALEREYYHQRQKTLVIFLPLIICAFCLVYFVSGYFRYYAIAIASNSMIPNIYKGDVVIVDKYFKDIKQGDILAYNYDNKVVVHRVYKIINTNGEYYIYTKGDANQDYDKYKITQDMFVGIVKAKIPLIGYPTVLLNERW